MKFDDGLTLQTNSSTKQPNHQHYRILADLAADYSYVLVYRPETGLRLAWMTETSLPFLEHQLDEQHLLQEWATYIHPADRTLFEPPEDMFSRYLAAPHNQVHKQDFRVQSQQGNFRWLRQRTQVLPDETEPQTLWLYCSVQDITERKTVAQSLELRLRQLAIINDIGKKIAVVSALDPLLNRAALLIQKNFDYHHVALFFIDDDFLQLRAIAGSYVNFFPPNHRQKVSQGINGWVARHGKRLVANDVRQTGQYISLIAEHTVTRAELCLPVQVANSTIGVLDIQSPTLNAFDQKDIEAMETLTDQIAIAIENARLYETVQQELAERRRAEAALRESQTRLQSILDNVADAIITTDVQNRIETFNAAAERMFGYSSAEMQGHRIGFLLFDDHAASPNQPETPFTLSEPLRPYSQMLVGQHQQGHTFPAEVAASAFVLAERKLYIAIVRDITRRVQLEQELRQAQKMEAIGRLAGGIAHDFNNLLTIINGYSEVLLDSEFEADDPRLEDIQEIKASGERAIMLVRQLLTFSHRQVLQPQPLDINEVVREMEKMLTRLIGEDIRLHTDLDDNIGLVALDLTHLEQVVMNLAVNARDAMPKGGDLCISTRPVTFTQADAPPDLQAGQYVKLSITDTGQGMDAVTRSHIFEPFFTTKGLHKGTGLGLSTVYSIVQQNQGHITVNSRLGQGTEFVLYWPQIAAPDSTINEPEILPLPPGHETILLVEDEKTVRQIARTFLLDRGYTVLDVALPQEAMALPLNQLQSVDLLVTDVVMPQMSGWELAQILLERHPTLKTLYISGYIGDVLNDHGLDLTDVHLLEKPFSGYALAQAVYKVLHG